MEKKSEKRRLEFKKFSNHIDPNRGFFIPQQLCLRRNESGIFFGKSDKAGRKHYIGMPQGTDGNIIIIGGNGSGKSTGIIKPTLETWQGAICATDIKGELSEYYERALKDGRAKRPCIIFDPTQSDGIGYDPFWWLSHDDEANLYTNIMDIVCTIIPEIPNDNQPFWVKSEQSALAAGLIYYYGLGLDFIDSLCCMLNTGLSGLCSYVKTSNNDLANIILGQLAEMKDETIANIDRGLRNYLIPFIADPHITQSFCGNRRNTDYFNWEDFEQFNIFLRIPGDKIDQWGSAINLMYAQLIRYLERRPEQYSLEGQNNIQTLLMLDEFPRFGKLEIIVDAIPTLRSKNVNICLVVQSIAQLDRLYDEYGRRIIFDNCQYQVILRANDAETQEYLCHLIGSVKVLQESVSRTLDQSGETIGYGKQRTEILEPRVLPHELATLTDTIILSPYGCSRAKKLPPLNTMIEQVDAHINRKTAQHTKGGSGILSIEENAQRAQKHAELALRNQRLEEKKIRDLKKKEADRRNFIIGELVVDAFPELLSIIPGTASENEVRFQNLKQILNELTTAPELIQKLKEKADFEIATKKIMADFSDRLSSQCVSGHDEGAES